jgi:SAM-dependent methyltransferase
MAEYTYTLDEADLRRYRSMAARAVASEGKLWDAAGITAGAAVLDLGCGPGAFLPELAERTGPAGRVVGVDESVDAATAARELVEHLDLGHRIAIKQTRAQDTGLDPGSFDVVFIRNLLVHNGPAAEAILRHVRELLLPGGHLLAAEPDVRGLRFPESAAAEQELEQRWVQMAVADGNDPSLGAGKRLAQLITAHGFRVDAARHRVDQLAVERSPAWTARQLLVGQGFATADDISRWEHAITTRLREVGLLTCQLPVSTVLARPLMGQQLHRRPARAPWQVRSAGLPTSRVLRARR